MDCEHTTLVLLAQNPECATYQCAECGATVGVDRDEFEPEVA
jgi:hypothetical protein